MKNTKIILTTLFVLTPIILFAEGKQKEPVSTKDNELELRVGANFSKEFDRVNISLEEEFRFGNFIREWDRANTTLSMTYHVCDYFKLGGGYVLKLYNKDWSDVNDVMRHRLYFDVTGQYKITRNVKIGVKERFVADFRTDSVNRAEEPQNALHLRTRLMFDYDILGKPMRIYSNFEIINTLNAVTFRNYDYKLPYDGRQYINSIQAWIGYKYRFDKCNSLNFYYKFEYLYNRDVNITKSKHNIEINNHETYKHIIGIAYEFAW